MLNETAGKLVAHIVGGSMFLSIGIATAVILGPEVFKQRASYGKVHSVDSRDIERLYDAVDGKKSETERPRNKKKFYIGLTAAIFVILGFLMEAINGVIVAGSFFHFFAHEVQHLIFLPWALTFMLESGCVKTFEDVFEVAPLYSVCSLIMAHLCQFLLLDGHVVMKKMEGLSNIEVDMHAIMAITARISFVVVTIQVLGHLAKQEGIDKGLYVFIPAPLILQGVWVLTIAYISYFAQYENLETEIIYSLYYMQIMIVVIIYAFVLRYFYKNSVKI